MYILENNDERYSVKVGGECKKRDDKRKAKI